MDTRKLKSRRKVMNERRSGSKGGRSEGDLGPKRKEMDGGWSGS
jgi:hypothetical protein